MIRLRDYQDDVIVRARPKVREHQAVVLQLPTGGGKTPIGTFMVKSASDKGHTTVFMVPRRELVTQTSLTFTDVGIPHSFVAAGFRFNPRMRVHIATVGTLANRLEKVAPPKLLIVDECHHAPANDWLKIINWAKASGGKVVGLTATPWRLDGGGFTHIFDDMVRGPTVPWLIANGYLSDYRMYAPFTPDLSGVHTRAGEYVTAELEAILSGKAVVGNYVSQWRRFAAGKKTAVFGVSVQHSEQIAAEFNAAGVPAAHVDGDTPDHVRRQHILNFAHGHLQVLCNVMLFSEGFDLSAVAGVDAPIECVMLARPTQSLSLYLQQVGRALRKKPDPAIILDLSGNAARHGMPDHPHEWTLEARPKKKRGGKGEAEPRLVRDCPACEATHSLALAACPACGHEYQPMGRQVEEVAVELKEVSKEEMQRQRKVEQGRAQSLDQLIELARARGYKSPEKWASHVYTSRLQKMNRYPAYA